MNTTLTDVIDRVAMTFGAGRVSWDPDGALDRYELLYEANAVAESRRVPGAPADGPAFGEEMARDHRRVLATAISRLRGKLPVPIKDPYIAESIRYRQP